jgi:hypothetical protein
MSITNDEYWTQFSKFVSVIPKQYLSVLLVLHDKLDGKNIKWVVSGDLAELLRTVKVEPDCIEIVTSKNDAHQIFQIVQEFEPSQMSFLTQLLPRKAMVAEKEYSVYIRSYYFDFIADAVKVKVEGNLQFKVGSWDWGDVFDFEPEYVTIVGKKTALTPLSIASELYHCLGWIDRVEKISEVTKKLHKPKKAVK